MKPVYLKFASEVQAASILYSENRPNYQNVDVIGAMFEPTGNTLTDGEGGSFPEMAPIEGWHVNVALIDGEDEAELMPFAVQPNSPSRVWA